MIKTATAFSTESTENTEKNRVFFFSKKHLQSFSVFSVLSVVQAVAFASSSLTLCVLCGLCGEKAVQSASMTREAAGITW